tara:strand:- start:75602 stop:77806 length:2205 start_codon:yes stop_codon:yes gene_type:complete
MFESKYKSINLAALIVIPSLLLTLYATKISYDFIKERAEVKFEDETSETIEDILERLNQYEQALTSGVALFQSSNNVTRDEWKKFTTAMNIGERYPGFQGVGFAKILQPGEINEHISEIKREGFPDYKVWPEYTRSIYTSIIYLEPFDWRNQRAFGYDMSTNETRWKAMKRAGETGLTSITGKVTLVQETDSDIQAGFLMYVPLYRNDTPAETIEERRANLVGYVYSAFRMNDLMQGVLVKNKTNFHFNIYDGDNNDVDNVMYGSDEETSGEYTSKFSKTQLIRLPGHEWTVTFNSVKSFDKDVSTFIPLAILFLGLIINTLIFVLLTRLINERKRINIKADELSKEIVNKNKELEFEINERANIEIYAKKLFNTASEAIITLDSLGVILSFNPAATTIFGYQCEEIIGQSVSCLVPELHKNKVLDYLINNLGLQNQTQNVHEFTGLRKDKSLINIEITVGNMKINEKHSFTIFIRDITSRKEMHEKLTTLNTELLRSNEDLAQFAYVASHDLQEPLRMIASYVQLLQKRYSGEIDDKADKFIAYTVDGCQRMESLIDGLLNFSRIDSSKEEMEIIDVNKAMDDIVHELNIRIKETNTTVKWSELHDVYARPTQFLTVLRNLISNAIKYNKSNTPVIQVDSKLQENGKVEISVQDNGIGIREEYADKIFIIFKRLHSRNEYPGTGIGLSLCKKIVERHGGEISFVSKEGAGTTFYFTMSPAIDNDIHYQYAVNG